MQCFFLVFYWKCRYSCASICCVIEFLIISFLLALEFLKKIFLENLDCSERLHIFAP